MLTDKIGMPEQSNFDFKEPIRHSDWIAMERLLDDVKKEQAIFLAVGRWISAYEVLRTFENQVYSLFKMPEHEKSSFRQMANMLRCTGSLIADRLESSGKELPLEDMGVTINDIKAIISELEYLDRSLSEEEIPAQRKTDLKSLFGVAQ